MIRIHRPPLAPEVLITKGAARRREHEVEVDADPGSFASGAVKLTFDRDVYAHESVKTVLIAMQHEKCAFCEAKPLHVSDGDVEHFRPKGGVRQADSEPLERPGYYWLAYEWHNLLFACERCNRRHKKSLFPLSEPARRATSHRDALTDEDPVFIDPSIEDPERYIGYREHIPIAIGGNPPDQALGGRSRVFAHVPLGARGSRRVHLKRRWRVPGARAATAPPSAGGAPAP